MNTSLVPRQQDKAKSGGKSVRKSAKIKKKAKDRAKGDRESAVPLSQRKAKLEEMKADFAKQERIRKKNATKKRVTKGRANQITAWQRFYKNHLERRNSVIAFDEATAAAAAVWELGLTQKDLRQLKNKFELIDLDGSGEIDYDEFFGALACRRSRYCSIVTVSSVLPARQPHQRVCTNAQCLQPYAPNQHRPPHLAPTRNEIPELIQDTRSPYTDALFALIDQDGSGSIDFAEFIHVLSTYCMYTREDILQFCFETFDTDGSGAIEEDEFMGMMKVRPLCR